ncbi:MAG: DUF91 domain-containing protein [Oscillatoriales cyanobacterium]|nr:MAG: DUF91 domain-containing protein [Oscillatoriales cyanobacterium]
MTELETVRLQRSGDRWWFQSESDLEEFLWLRGETIFGWRWLARQLAIDGQFCDLVAVDRDGALVVVELKNEEDKYIVQQLTRYFHALIEARPFADVVDYSLRGHLRTWWIIRCRFVWWRSRHRFIGIV